MTRSRICRVALSLKEQEHETKYKDANWRFASAADLLAFHADPETYAPQYGCQICVRQIFAANKHYMACCTAEALSTPIADTSFYSHSLLPHFC